MGIATGEVFAFPEGKLYLYASASGTASGSGVAWVENAEIGFVYGWLDEERMGGVHREYRTGQRVDLTIGTMVGDLSLWRLADAGSALNAKFEGLVTGGRIQSAQWIIYSGMADSVRIAQQDGDLFRGQFAMHGWEYSGFGG
jgi:hypothetical protein